MSQNSLSQVIGILADARQVLMALNNSFWLNLPGEAAAPRNEASCCKRSLRQLDGGARHLMDLQARRSFEHNGFPEVFQLLTSLGRRFIAKFLIALLAADGHFITLLLSTLWGLRGGFTTLCLQGIFGSGKTYCASMMLVIATSILGIPTLLTAEPNLPLYTAADTICDLLREASDPVRAQYARLLAQNIPVAILLSTTARKIAPTYFRKILLFAVSSSPRVAYYVNCATPTLISPPSSKRFAWPSTTNLNKAGRQGSP